MCHCAWMVGVENKCHCVGILKVAISVSLCWDIEGGDQCVTVLGY